MVREISFEYDKESSCAQDAMRKPKSNDIIKINLKLPTQ